MSAELKDGEIIALISNHDKILDLVFDEASLRHARLDDQGEGAGTRLVDPEGTLDPKHDPAASAPHPAFADQDAYVQVDRAATRAQAVKALRALAAQGKLPHCGTTITENRPIERFVHPW